MLTNLRFLLLFAFLLQGCSAGKMKITVSKNIVLEGIPSGSGIEKQDDLYYVIGDDSPYLYCLDNDFKTISKTLLLDTAIGGKGRIRKAEKADFESMEKTGENEFVILGSGSKSPQRDVFIRVLLQDSIIIEPLKAAGFYNSLRGLPQLKNSELNIEATAFSNNHLFLFNRKKNLIIKFDYNELMSYLKGERTFPTPEIKEFTLPKINGIEAGFSGATALLKEPKIIFTASVENTTNAYDDGEILGSFIGMIDLSFNVISSDIDYCLIPNTDGNLKVESVTIEEEISSGKTKVILITDDDKGNSRLLESELFW